MVKAVFLKDVSGFLCGFRVCGHAGFAELGQDIVCAAVSSASYLVVNTIVDVMRVNPRKLWFSEGELGLVLGDADLCICDFLLRGFFLHLEAMSEQYPKNLSVRYRKVV